MIFLFFGSSLGPLEPELAPFKDLEEIGDIWEISFKVVQCSAVQLGHQAGADATLREMSQMSQISCQSLNRANSGVSYSRNFSPCFILQKLQPNLADPKSQSNKLGFLI